jgi:hypothetical protein
VVRNGFLSEIKRKEIILKMSTTVKQRHERRVKQSKQRGKRGREDAAGSAGLVGGEEDGKGCKVQIG